MPAFKEFLATGAMGGLVLGMSQGQVVNLSGEPEFKGQDRHTEIWGYGSLQLHFFKQDSNTSLTMIVVDFEETTSLVLPESLIFGDWCPGADTTFEQFLQFLSTQGLVGNLRKGLSFDSQCCYVLEPNVTVLFIENHLHKILSADRRKGGQEMKKLSVDIPLSRWEQLHRLATASKKSMAKMCSEWIQERLDVECSEAATKKLHELQKK